MTMGDRFSRLYSGKLTVSEPVEQPPEHALAKCRERWSDFEAAGWRKDDILFRHPKSYGYHGLAWCLQEYQDIGRIFPYCVEILGRPSNTGERSRLYYARGEPSATLVARHGRDAIFPPELGTHNNLGDGH